MKLRELFVVIAIAALVFVPSLGKLALAKSIHAAAVLIIADPATPSTLDPDFSNTDESWAVMQNAYGSITDLGLRSVGNGVSEVDLKRGPIAGLASSWTISPDHMTYTFHLKNAKSPTGDTLTSQDVDWSWRRALAVKGSGAFVFGITSVNTKHIVHIINQHTFSLHLTGPNPLLLSVFSIPMPFAPVFDSKMVKKHATTADPWARTWLSTHTAGYGPYSVAQYSAGQQVVWKANPNYYGQKPKLGQINFRAVPDESTRLSLIKSGAVDMATFLGPRSRQAAARSSGVKVLGVQGNIGLIVGVNTTSAPFTKQAVRQAVAYSIPVNEIIKTVFLGSRYATNFKGVVPSTYPFAKSPAFHFWPYTYNIAKARKLMLKAGIRSTSTTLDINATHPEQQQTAIIIRDSLARIGIHVTINTLNPAAYQQQYQTRKAPMVLVEDTPWVPDPGYALANYFYPGPAGVANWTNYHNPKAAKLMQQTLNTSNPTARLRIAGKANRVIENDAPWPAYIGTGEYVTVRSNVGGYVWRTDNLLDFRYFYKK